MVKRINTFIFEIKRSKDMSRIPNLPSKYEVSSQRVEERNSTALTKPTNKYSLICLLLWFILKFLSPEFELLLHISIYLFDTLCDLLHTIHIFIFQRTKTKGFNVIPTVALHSSVTGY